MRSPYWGRVYSVICKVSICVFKDPANEEIFYLKPPLNDQNSDPTSCWMSEMGKRSNIVHDANCWMEMFDWVPTFGVTNNVWSEFWSFSRGFTWNVSPFACTSNISCGNNWFSVGNLFPFLRNKNVACTCKYGSIQMKHRFLVSSFACCFQFQLFNNNSASHSCAFKRG